MKKEFIQEILNKMLFRKLTTNIPSLRREKLNEHDMKDIERTLKADGMIDSWINTKQDPEEVKEMLLKAFDESVILMRKRFDTHFDQIVKHFLQ